MSKYSILGSHMFKPWKRLDLKAVFLDCPAVSGRIAAQVNDFTFWTQL